MSRMRVEQKNLSASEGALLSQGPWLRSLRLPFRIVPSFLLTLATGLLAPNGFAGEVCDVDTTLSDFQQGSSSGLDLHPPGDVTLAANLALDQQNENLTINGFTFHHYWWFGQTFKAGVSGPLTAAEVRLFCNACVGPPPDITVSIRATLAGKPDGPDLAAATIPGFVSASGGWYRVNFDSPMTMSSGVEYALVVRADAPMPSGSYAYLVSATDDAYTDGVRVTSTTAGTAWDIRNRDVGFRIFTGSGFVAAGNLVSSPKDADPAPGDDPLWTTLSWNGATPPQTSLKFQAAASDVYSGPYNFVGPDGTAGTYFTSSGADLSQFNGMRYLKYKALLSTGNTSVSPALNDVTTCHDGTPQPADLRITKTDGATSATAGSPVTYTIVASNAGPGGVPGATVTDTFPATLQGCNWSCAGSAGGSCPPSGSGNINHVVGLPPGASATFTATCNLSPGANGSLVNTATVSSPVPDPDSGNNSATDNDTVLTSADVALSNSNGTSTSTPGESVTYSIIASNNGPSNAASAMVSDTFPSALQNCTWNCAGSSGGSCPASGSGNINAGVGLPVGAIVNFTANCDVDPGASGSLANTATVSSATPDPVPGNNSQTDTDTLVPVANLGITKTDGSTTATAGGPVTYTIVASNAGPSNVAGATVADSFPAALENCEWSCSGSGGGSCPPSGSGTINAIIDLPASASVTFTATCDVNSGATGSLVNTATVSSAVFDPASGNNSATDTDTLGASADLGITKTDGASESTPGDPISYTIVASNAGPSDVASANVVDSFPAELQNCTWNCSGGSGGSCPASGSGNIDANVGLPAGASVTLTASCDISVEASGSLSNTATVSAGTEDPVAGNNSATDVNTLAGSADLNITKTDSSATATPGGSVTYTIVARNSGPGNATVATVSDAFAPALDNCNWTCSGATGASCAASGAGDINENVSLPAGGSTTFTATCHIDPAATGTLGNTATVSSALVDPAPGNNSATDNDDLVANADLQITKTDGASTSVPGGSVVYTIVASNAGPSDAPSATVSDVFGPKLQNCSWTCTGSDGGSCPASGSGNINANVSLPVGASVTFTPTCDVSGTASGSLANTASVSSEFTDPVPGNNSATDTNSLEASADLSITKTDGISTASPGDSVVYTIVASNGGPSPVDNAMVVDSFPAELENCEWVCSGHSGGNCASFGDGNINENVGLPAGANVEFSVICDIDIAATGSLVNTGSVTSAVADPEPGNNSATDTDTLEVLADLAIWIDDGTDIAIPGATVTYHIGATNMGSSAADNASIEVAFPVAASLVSWTCVASGGASCSSSGNSDINDSLTMPVGGSVVYTAEYEVPPEQVDPVVVTGLVSSPVTDPDMDNNWAEDVNMLESDMILSKGFE